ncbi:MAG: ABC transporter substrate-binding protein [Gemmatimonadaceae bacterium]
MILQPRRAASIALAFLTACTAERQETQTVVYASGADLESANPLVTVHPLSRQIQRYALFVTLARYDSLLRAQPYFARAWEWSTDRRGLTFFLHRGLRWQDSTATSARDVVFTLNAARDPATGYYRVADLAGIESIDAPNDTTVRLRFSSPQPELPTVFCELPIAPAHLLENVARSGLKGHGFATAPVGNGPFRFTRRDPGERWIFERNADFPAFLGGPPTLRRVVVTVVDEPTTKFAGLVSGDLHVAGIAPSMAELTAEDPTLGVLSYPVLFATALVFNTTRPPFDDAHVRRALSAAIDRKRIVEVALSGFATPSAAAVSLDNPRAFAASPLSRDSIATWLAAAGWVRATDGVWSKGGRRFTFTILTVGSGDNAIEQLVQADLRAIGVDVAIRQIELGTFLTTARATSKTFDALIAGIPGDLALSYLTAMFDSRYAGGALDYAGYHTRQLDALFANVYRAQSPAELDAAWRGVQQQLAVETPVAWLYHSRGVQGISRRLQNVEMDLRGELVTLARWRLAASAER